jgi:hypothetical protein
MKKRDPNQGEGSKTAAKEYDEKATKFARSGPVDERAREARQAIEGDEADTLRDAEAEGKSRLAEEDPEIRRP